MLIFNAENYQETLRLAGNAWRNADGKADDFARNALAALVNDDLSPMALAMSVYDEMRPTAASGKLAEPKESERAAGGVSVSSLRSAKGGEGARKCLETIFYVLDNRALDFGAVSDFVMNTRGAFKLFPLQRHLAKLKADAAREAAQVAKGDAEGGDLPEREGDEATDAQQHDCPIMAAAELIGELAGDDLAANADAIALLLDVCRDAAARIAAADRLQLAA